jgi:hypothetical protein
LLFIVPSGEVTTDAAFRNPRGFGIEFQFAKIAALNQLQDKGLVHAKQLGHRLKMAIELMANIRVGFFYIMPTTNPSLRKLLITNKQERYNQFFMIFHFKIRRKNLQIIQ